jgi:hypothetical protein
MTVKIVTSTGGPLAPLVSLGLLRGKAMTCECCAHHPPHDSFNCGGTANGTISALKLQNKIILGRRPAGRRPTSDLHSRREGRRARLTADVAISWWTSTAPDSSRIS